MTKTTTQDSTAEFSAQYKDPRWQKKRLEVLEYDKFTCQRCGATDKELHVHHSQYTKGAKVWDYPVCALITLCSDCHSDIHKMKDEISNVWEFFNNYRYGDASTNFPTYDTLYDIYCVINSCGFGFKIIGALLEMIEEEKHKSPEAF